MPISWKGYHGVAAQKQETIIVDDVPTIFPVIVGYARLWFMVKDGQLLGVTRIRSVPHYDQLGSEYLERFVVLDR